MRNLYTEPKRMSESQRLALFQAWVWLKIEAVDAASEGRKTTARRLAEHARNLVTEFGVRRDGRKTRPFPVRRPQARAS